MTDFERLTVAWDQWARTAAAVASGLRLGPVLLGAAVTCVMITGAALRPMFSG